MEIQEQNVIIRCQRLPSFFSKTENYVKKSW